MFTLGNGFPLWDPTGSISRPEIRLREGIRIGDVGLVSRRGDFTFYFNIFLSKTDPYQHLCPPEHEPLLPALDPSEVDIDQKHFRPGTTLVSNGISVSRLSESPMYDLFFLSFSDLIFTTKAREGGIVVLPDGASREDLASTSRLLPYVRKHALEWYLFINEGGTNEPHPNGTLYLVTGCDRAKDWALAVTPQEIEKTGRTTKIRYQQVNRQPWDENPAFSTKRASDKVPHIESCPIFIRGMRIAIDMRSWTKHILKNEPPQYVPHFNLLRTPILGIQADLLTTLEQWRNYPENFQPVITKARFITLYMFVFEQCIHRSYFIL
ncbi:hypothetical protein CPB84DRAFT_1678561 [Gymnopilus junonius]|uniref:Uncharacterized protein n=1 Tax=Gymnopilus junonius TaxID=109634 RepID=A0A9P5TQ17_GYMJU|nr:hypothetical protein CPB84DRAFT_1678561 [Gymnopilus junonius]